MGALKDLAKSFSRITQEEVDLFCMEYGIDKKFNPTAPSCDVSVDKPNPGSIALYCRHFQWSNLRYPFSFFVLNLLEYYRVSFGQVHPKGMARVLHFEVLCRALGYDPSLLLFRRFFRLAKNGDWFTFETSKVDICLISSMVTTLGSWKDRFFWVSESIVPFKMVWRHPDAVLNDPEPSESELNNAFLIAIRGCPSRVRPFPEHLLVLLGVSNIWGKADRDPVLMRNGMVMSALDFIKSDDTSDVMFEDAPSVPGENVVVRTAEQRFEGTGYASAANVKVFSKSNAPKSSTRRSSRRLLKAGPQSTSTEPVDLSDDIEVSEDQGGEADAEKGKGLVVRGKKVPSKKVVSTPVQESSSRDVEGLDPEGTYVPAWLVKNDDTFKDAAVCEDALSHLAPPSVHKTIAGMDDDLMLSRMVLSTCNLAAMLPQGITRFRQRMQEYEDFSKKKDKMKSSIASMKKEIAGFAEKEAAWRKEVSDLKKMHGIEMGDLKKSFEANLLKLKADREALAVQQQAFREEKEGLKASVGRATADNQWLIEHGFQQVVTYLLHSKEFNSALGDVYTKLLNLGKHQGLIAGYKLHESGHPLEKSPLFRPEASDVFKGSIEQMERLTYPYVYEVSSCFGKPLSVLQDLKPEGLNEEVCAEVLGSLSKKRSYSGDSDDTLSSQPDVSKDVGLEASAVGGDDGAKAKKSKKAKRSKAEGSKPSAV
uniref:Putative transposase (Putative), gypsy type n=1 Tax=Helianthus annuus TaxID=4232 RepID=A0A251UFU0_HELAN